MNEIRERKIFNTKERRGILRMTGGKCAHCGKGLNEDTMTVEHVWPWSKGGLNDRFNILALCKDCNIEKSNLIYPMSYYKYILPEFEEEYDLYRGYVSAISPVKTIMQLDYKEYRGVGDSYEKLKLMARIAKKGKKGMELAYSMQMKAKLERAYPGDADRIFKFVQRCDSKKCLISGMHYYDNVYCIGDDIAAGEVYILGNGIDIYGLFSFRPIEDGSVSSPQIENIAEELGLKPSLVMTAAMTSLKGVDFFSMVLDDMFRWQVHRKRLPLYFGILGKTFKEDYISLPYRLHGHDGEIETQTIAYYRKWFTDEAEWVIGRESEHFGWKPEDDAVERLAELMMAKRSISEFTEEEKKFLGRMKGAERYFIPESYDKYGEGVSYFGKEG